MTAIALHFPKWGSTLAGVVSCAELSRTPALGRCPAGAQAAAIPPQAFAPAGFSSSQAETVWPAAHIFAERLSASRSSRSPSAPAVNGGDRASQDHA
jgi:hypothetical protein